MKKKIFLLIMLFIPVLINAKTINNFNVSKNYTNKYIYRFKDYNDYIELNTNKYGYNDSIYYESGFEKGGFLNKKEFLISKDTSGNTYLFNGANYWTMTNSGSQYYILDIKSIDNLKLINSNETSGSRITEYVKSNIKVYGSGTYSDPWKFKEIKNIKITYDNNGGTGCTTKTVKKGNRYGTLCTPTKENYTFKGWYSDSSLTTEVNENTITRSNENIILYAKWEGREFTLTYNSTGGSSCESKTVIYGQIYGILCESKREGYSFDGWYTEEIGGIRVTLDTIVSGNLTVYAHWGTCLAGTYSDGSTVACKECPSGYISDAGATAQNSCYINVTAGNYLATAKGTEFTQCAAGKYKVAHKVNYGSTSSCSSCPTGYMSAAGATAQNSCYITVTAGNYLATAKGTEFTQCAAGKYKAAHNVNYGSTSSCSSCPTGYTSAAGASVCYITVTAGNYLATAKGTEFTQCAVGKYKAAHNVNYGSTSSCSSCPTGYTSDAGTTAQNKCYISVSANKYIATANSSTQTSCATGYNKAAHTVNYGSTSSCTANTYTISYNSNGGSGTAMSITSCTYGSNCTLRSNTYTRSGYTFKGWSTSSTATTATYTNAQSVKNLTATDNDTITLYAVWKSDLDCEFDGDLVQGAEYVNGQYTYKYKKSYDAYYNLGWQSIYIDGWGVILTDKNSTAPVTTKLCRTINGKPIVSMKSMFYNSKATSIDLSSFDTSNVTSMSYMFYGAQATSLNLSSFDTSKVSTMAYMFYSTKATQITGLNKLNTSNVTSMTYMFDGTNVSSIDVSGFDTSKVTNMFAMFAGSKATKITGLNKWNTSKLVDMGCMFSRSNATSLDLSSFDTSHVTNMEEMFWNSEITTVNGLETLNTSNVTRMRRMFRGSKITTLNLSKWNTENVKSMDSMFESSKATTINVSNFNTSKVTDMSYMFDGSQATTLDLSSFDTSNVTNMSWMFYYSKATTIYVSNKWNDSNVTSSTNMFDNNINLVGGNGTRYSSSNPKDKTYARVDKSGSPGYFTLK